MSVLSALTLARRDSVERMQPQKAHAYSQALPADTARPDTAEHELKMAGQCVVLF